MSAARRASNTCTRMPNPCAAVSTALSCRAPVVGSHSTPTPESVGTVSMRSCRHFALKSGKSMNTPVTLPPGRARLLTKPRHRITFQVDRDDRNARRGAGCRLNSGRGDCHDGIDSIVNQPCRERRQARYVPIGKTDYYLGAGPTAVVRVIQALADCRNAHVHSRRFTRIQHSDLATFRRLLRPRRERPSRRGTAKQCDELAPFHSITSSAATSSLSGTVRPSALAVLRLMTSSPQFE